MVAIEGVKGTYTDASITGITCWFCQGCGNAIDVARVDTQDGVYKDIVDWAKDKGILSAAQPEKQMLKTVEEVGELADAIGREHKADIADAIGDVVVTLVIQAEMQEINFRECIEEVYGVISKRTGKMENGLFVKDS